MAMTNRVRCAVIGLGFAGSTYAEAVRYAADAELVLSPAVTGRPTSPRSTVSQPSTTSMRCWTRPMSTRY
jgi:hypothetical protein